MKYESTERMMLLIVAIAILMLIQQWGVPRFTETLQERLVSAANVK